MKRIQKEMQKKSLDKKIALERQRNEYREKLEQKRRLAERRLQNAKNSKNSTPTQKPDELPKTQEVLEKVSEKLQEETGTRESSVSEEVTGKPEVENRKRKPRSAAIERILAMTKKKRTKKSPEENLTPENSTPVLSPAPQPEQVQEPDSTTSIGTQDSPITTVTDENHDENQEEIDSRNSPCPNSGRFSFRSSKFP